MITTARTKRESESWSAFVASPGKQPDQTWANILLRNRQADLALTARLLPVLPRSVQRMIARPDLLGDPTDRFASWNRVIRRYPEGSRTRRFWEAGRDYQAGKLSA